MPKDAADVGQSTMSGATAICPFCKLPQPDDHIKRCGHEGKLKAQLTTVVYQEGYGKEYRPPTPEEINAAKVSAEKLEKIANEIPHGIPGEPLPSKDRHRAVGSQLPDYGFQTWSDLFTPRQLLTLMTFVKWTRAARKKMEKVGYVPEWIEAIESYLSILANRLVNYTSTICIWETNAGEIKQTFIRFALPMTWDFAESNPLYNQNRYYRGAIDSVGRFLAKMLSGLQSDFPLPDVTNSSAQNLSNYKVAAIITDPPYYDAIPYSDLADFFYVWLRRSIGSQFQSVLGDRLTPKSKELVQQHKTGERGLIGKQFYENGMAQSFRTAHKSLTDDGRLVIVFAHKAPDAWETLTTAMIDAGLVVTASWPIDTEMQGGVRSQVASLATSLWLVCRKRPTSARVGYYKKIRSEMKERITETPTLFLGCWDSGTGFRLGGDWARVGKLFQLQGGPTHGR